MQLNEPWMQRPILKVEYCRFEDVRTEFFPRLPLSEDGMAKRAWAITTLFRIAHLED